MRHQDEKTATLNVQIQDGAAALHTTTMSPDQFPALTASSAESQSHYDEYTVDPSRSQYVRPFQARQNMEGYQSTSGNNCTHPADETSQSYQALVEQVLLENDRSPPPHFQGSSPGKRRAHHHRYRPCEHHTAL